MKCIEDEIPFEVPEGWEWARISSLSIIVTDGEHKTPLRCDNYEGYYLLSARNIQNGYIALNNVDYVDQEEFLRISKRCSPKRNDILISCSGSVGRVTTIADGNNYVMVRSVAMVRFMEIIPLFAMFSFQSRYLQTQMQQSSKQTAQANLFQAAISNLLMPIPPLAEQNHIVQKISVILEQNDSIENDAAEISSLISKAKAKILDLAIRGKLVPQDPNDEPASVLLERIHAEKEELIKRGKIKRDKKESIIFRGEDNSYFEKIGNNTFDITDSIPFEIPDTWIWCRLKSVASNEDNSFVDGPFGSDLKTIHYTDKEEVRIVQLNNIGEGGWKDARKKYTTFLHAENIERCISFPEDIVIAKMMPAGRAIILPSVNSMYVISSDCIRLRADYRLHKDYLMFMLNSPSINKCVLETVQGIGRTRTSLNKMKDILIPVPPKSEQQKICKKLTMCFDYLTSIYNSLMITT